MLLLVDLSYLFLYTIDRYYLALSLSPTSACLLVSASTDFGSSLALDLSNEYIQ